jgi:ubiquinone/menaquinone biosynthesis C-methylase UbiE
MKFATFFSKQAKRPTGLYGRFIMSKIFEKGNVELNSLVLESLSVKNNERVLEIGIGTGLILSKIAASMDDGLVEGVDFSDVMVNVAKKKNRRYINAGKAKIHSGDFNEIEFEDNSFDKIFTVNTIYFWKEPDETIFKIHRLLKPGGQLFIGFHRKSDMEKMPLNRDVFRYYSTSEMIELLSVRGPMNNAEIISKEGKQAACFCAVAAK